MIMKKKTAHPGPFADRQRKKNKKVKKSKVKAAF